MSPEDIQIDLELIKSRLDALQALRKRKRGVFRSKLSRCADVIFTLRDIHGASFQTIKLYLWKYHRLKVSRANVCHFYYKVTNEALEANQSQNDWGEAGSI